LVQIVHGGRLYLDPIQEQAPERLLGVGVRLRARHDSHGQGEGQRENRAHRGKHKICAHLKQLEFFRHAK